MRVGDLTSLANLKRYLSATGTADDALLALLITGASGVVSNYINRDIRSVTRTELRNGTDSQTLAMMQWPVTDVSAVKVNGNTIPKSSDGVLVYGYTFDDKFLYLVGNPQYANVPTMRFSKGPRNVSVTYTAGYLVGAASPDNVVTFPAEAATVPAAAGPYTIVPARTPINDVGVKYANGTAFVAVASAPGAGQYVYGQLASGDVGYTFSAADASQAVLLSYGYCPSDIELALWQITGKQYRDRTRLGERSKALAGEVVSFDLSLIMGAARETLDNFKRRIF